MPPRVFNRNRNNHSKSTSAVDFGLFRSLTLNGRFQRLLETIGPIKQTMGADLHQKVSYLILKQQYLELLSFSPENVLGLLRRIINIVLINIIAKLSIIMLFLYRQMYCYLLPSLLFILIFVLHSVGDDARPACSR